ncbi:MAG: hypothetical protein ACRDRT_07770 [Pseudonocardiaceae bacterium]
MTDEAHAKPTNSTGRVAPKGSGRVTPKASGRVTPKTTGRYTPPAVDFRKPSPVWIPILMFTFLGLGVLIILANYVDLLPGDGPSNAYLLGGLVSITAGFITAT